MFSIGTEAAALSHEHRLAGLYRIIPPAQIKRAIGRCGRRQRRCLRCSALFMVYFVLAMGLFCGDCYRQVFRWIGFRLKAQAPTAGKSRGLTRRCIGVPPRSTLCQARRRLGVKVLVLLARWTVQLLATTKTPGAFYRGLRLMALDGFVVDLFDSPVNAKVFGYAQGGRTRGAFPQARVVALCEAGTHVLWRWLIKPIATGEATMAHWLLKQLPGGTLLMWDRGFL